MNNRRKGFLQAASILTIISLALTLLLSVGIFASTSFINEDLILEEYKNDSAYIITMEDDGGYVITYEEDGEMYQITDEDIEISVIIVKGLICVVGVVIVGVSIASLVLAILVLAGTRKGKYKKGCTIALLVLSILNQSFLAAALFIVALCLKDENKPNIENKDGNERVDLNKIDVVLKDINE